MVLASINVYPVKSLGGASVGVVEVEPWGLCHDRRWLALRPDGTVLTAREQHRMLGVTATVHGDEGIMLTGLDGSTLVVEAPVDGELVPTALSRLAAVRLADREAGEWLSRQIGTSVRLGWLDDPRRRTVSLDHGGQSGDPLNLADAGPLLLTTTSSLSQLNQWVADDAARRGEELPLPMLMDRFRPSVVVDGADPAFVEDGWSGVRIGGVAFRFAERCDRCVLTTIDPTTLLGGKEPLRTLARHRARDHKTWFGIRLVPISVGTIRLGDLATPSRAIGISRDAVCAHGRAVERQRHARLGSAEHG